LILAANNFVCAARRGLGADPERSALGEARRARRYSVLHFRGTKVGVTPAKVGAHLSTAPLHDAGLPLSRQ